MKEADWRKRKSVKWKLFNSWWLILFVCSGTWFFYLVFDAIGEPDMLVYIRQETVFANQIIFYVYPLCWGILYCLCRDRLLGISFGCSYGLFCLMELAKAYDSAGGSKNLLGIAALLVVAVNMSMGIVFWRKVLERLAQRNAA